MISTTRPAPSRAILSLISNESPFQRIRLILLKAETYCEQSPNAALTTGVQALPCTTRTISQKLPYSMRIDQNIERWSLLSAANTATKIENKGAKEVKLTSERAFSFLTRKWTQKNTGSNPLCLQGNGKPEMEGKSLSPKPGVHFTDKIMRALQQQN